MSKRNIDPPTVEAFGEEWAAFTQLSLGAAEQQRMFDLYFEIFPFDDLPDDAEGFDLGCGSGRWAELVKARVGLLHCIDPSAKALAVAKERMAEADNIAFHLASVDDIPLADGSQDFGYSLGVLHHVPDPAAGLRACVAKLKTGAPFLLYCWSHVIDESDRVIDSGHRWMMQGSVFRRLAYANFIGNGSALLLSRQAVQHVGGYDPALRGQGGQGCEDLLIELQIAREFPVAVVPEFLVGYRSAVGSMSRDSAQMDRSWDLLWDVLNKQQAVVPTNALRWNRALRDLDLAQEAAVHGRWLNCLSSVASALWLDPLRTCAYLSYRWARTMVRLLRGRQAMEMRRSFYEASSGISVSGDPDALPALLSVVTSIEERRLKQIAREEAALPLGSCDSG